MEIRLLQLDVAMAERRANFETVRRKFALMAADGVPDVVALPELWDVGFYPRNAAELADPDGREARALLGELASAYRVNVVGGSIIRRDGDGIFNTAYVFDRTGGEVASYDKVHLFSPTREDEHFHAGEKLALFELDGVRMGVMVCYDLRFGELARALALRGARVLFVPAAWPHPRQSHWRALAVARAVENQFFVAAVNQCGASGKNAFCGNSLLVDPWGRVIAEAGEDETVLRGEFDLALVDDARARIDVFHDRRPGLYAAWFRGEADK